MKYICDYRQRFGATRKSLVTTTTCNNYSRNLSAKGLLEVPSFLPSIVFTLTPSRLPLTAKIDKESRLLQDSSRRRLFLAFLDLQLS
jgi:hypothetical protein